MDITQETITLLRLRLESIRRQVGPLRKYRAGRNCQKGYNCGGSCITRRKNCRKALGGEAKNFSEWMVQKMSAQIPAVLGDAPKDTNPNEWRDWGVKDIGKKDGSAFATEGQARKSKQYKEATDPTIVKQGDGYKIRTGQPMTEEQARIVLEQTQPKIEEGIGPNPFMGKREKPLSVRDPEVFEKKRQAEEVLGEGRFRWKKMDEYNPQLQAQYGISEAKFNQLRKDAGLPVKAKKEPKPKPKAEPTAPPKDPAELLDYIDQQPNRGLYKDIMVKRGVEGLHSMRGSRQGRRGGGWRGGGFGVLSDSYEREEKKSVPNIEWSEDDRRNNNFNEYENAFTKGDIDSAVYVKSRKAGLDHDEAMIASDTGEDRDTKVKALKNWRERSKSTRKNSARFRR